MKNDLISRQAAIDALDCNFTITGGDNAETVYQILKGFCDKIKALPSAQPEPISEEYAKAVRNWLVNYQVKCAELQGRYTPYEVLGWIVSDWRKDNGIW